MPTMFPTAQISARCAGLARTPIPNWSGSGRREPNREAHLCAKTQTLVRDCCMLGRRKHVDREYLFSIHLTPFGRSVARVGAVTLTTTGFALAQAPAADNTKANARDRQPGALTADQQKNDVTDRQATQKIRQSLMRDKGLSTYAHNVKVIARDRIVNNQSRL